MAVILWGLDFSLFLITYILTGDFLELATSILLMVYIVGTCFNSHGWYLLPLGKEVENRLKAAFLLLWNMETLRILFKIKIIVKRVTKKELLESWRKRSAWGTRWWKLIFIREKIVYYWKFKMFSNMEWGMREAENPNWSKLVSCQWEGDKVVGEWWHRGF